MAVVLAVAQLSCSRQEQPEMGGHLLLADRDTLSEVDLVTMESQILYETDGKSWLSAPSLDNDSGNVLLEKHDAKSGTFCVILVNRQGGQETTIIESANAYMFPSWSNRGDKFALQTQLPGGDTNFYTVRLFDLNGGLVKTLLPRSSGGKVSWSPDDRQVAYVDREERIVIVDVTSLESRVVGAGEWPLFSPGGDEVAYVDGDRLVAYGLAKGDKRVIASLGLFSTISSLSSWSDDGQSILGTVSKVVPFSEQHLCVAWEVDTGESTALMTLPAPLVYEWTEN